LSVFALFSLSYLGLVGQQQAAKSAHVLLRHGLKRRNFSRQ